MITSHHNSLGRRGPGHITLEALLDSPGLTPPSPLCGSVSTGVDINHLPTMKYGCVPTACFTDPNLIPVKQCAQSFPNSELSLSKNERKTLLNNIILELVSILKEQDVNGYFLFPLPISKMSKHHTRIGILDLEKQLLTGRYTDISDFQKDVNNLFSDALQYYSPDLIAHHEAQRLLHLSQDWFASLSTEQLTLLKGIDSDPSGNIEGESTFVSPRDGSVPRETNLSILNPDYDRIIGRMECLRSIGDEVGHLSNGSSLLPHGGYREDRRNKVIPYTYLDYGPYYSFAPSYDSGASHCTPETNQLLYGTTWLPARTAYVLDEEILDKMANNLNYEDKSLSEELVSAALTVGDQHLAVALAVADTEQRNALKMSAELEEILPGPEVSDDCVYSICLANAFTRGLLRQQGPTNGDSETSLSVYNPDSSDSKKISESNNKTDLTGKIYEPNCDLDDPCSNENAEVPEISASSQQESSKPAVSESNDELNEAARDLRALYCAQYLRLSDASQASNQGSSIRPNSLEISIAHRLARRLVNLAKRARPRDLIHPYSVRRAMGLKPHDFLLPEEVDSLDSNNDALPNSDETSVAI